MVVRRRWQEHSGRWARRLRSLHITASSAWRNDFSSAKAFTIELFVRAVKHSPACSKQDAAAAGRGCFGLASLCLSNAALYGVAPVTEGARLGGFASG